MLGGDCCSRVKRRRRVIKVSCWRWQVDDAGRENQRVTGGTYATHLTGPTQKKQYIKLDRIQFYCWPSFDDTVKENQRATGGDSDMTDTTMQKKRPQEIQYFSITAPP